MTRPDPTAAEGTLYGRVWHLADVDPALMAHASFRVDQDGSLTVCSPCNHVGTQGRVEVTEESITFPELTSTLMACDPQRAAAENRLLGALANATGYLVRGDELELLDQRGNPTRFTC